MARRGPKRMTLGHPKVDRLIEALTLGDFIEEACQYANIDQATYYRWLNAEPTPAKQSPRRSQATANCARH